jgi:hypothetical protein
MMSAELKPSAPRPGSSRSLKRLEFEMALDIGGGAGTPSDAIRQAAETAGGDLLVVLPAPDGNGVTGIVRLSDGGDTLYVEARGDGSGFTVRDETQIAAPLLSLARASFDVLQRLNADTRVVAPLRAAS